MNCTEKTLEALNAGEELPPDCKVYEWGGSYYVENNEIVCSLMECFVVPGASLGSANITEWLVTITTLLVLWLFGLTVAVFMNSKRLKQNASE